MNIPDGNQITQEQLTRLKKAEYAFSKQDYKTSEGEYRKLLLENLKLPEVYSQLAWICAMTNRLDEAKSLWETSLKLSPNYVNALLGLGDVYKYERDFNQAILVLKQVVALQPDHAMAYLSISYSNMQLGNYLESEKACLKALKIEPNFTQAQDYLGEIYNAKGEVDKAKKHFEQQINDNRQNIKALYSLGNLLKSQGNMALSASYYKKSLMINPLFSQAHFTYASVHKYENVDDEHIKMMLDILSKGNLDEASKIHLSFALAKAYEDAQSYTKAFTFLKKGNDLRFRKFNYKIEADEKFINNIIRIFNKGSIEAHQVSQQQTDKPIFIVGMPRSGTSLVERIISTHSKVFGAGELDYFFKLGTNDLISQESNFLYKELESYPKDIFKNIGDTYLSQISKINPEAKHITDKLPFNMLLVGLIKTVFPNAIIIHCNREPIDNCLSIYKKNFATDNYRFAYNLETLGKFHNLYKTLMQHWQDTFPNSVYQVHYEKLVSNPEQEIRDLIQACGLEWQETCLEFNKNKTIVKTASAAQVIKPIYKSSVKLWKHYEGNLAPLLNALNND